MCGIAGILRVHAPGAEPASPWESIPEQWLDILDDSIKHRGPDGAGRFRDRATRPDGTVVDVALVHRRLSIIDLACGHQPMVSLAKGEGVLPVKTHALGPGLGLYEPDGYEWLRARRASEERGVRSTTEGSSLARRARSDLVAVAFNGCIYNHRELRKELQAAGHVFSTDHSDTEVLVHGWREWGESVRERIDGMCAALIWDASAGTLCVMRDRFGEKPMYIGVDEVLCSYVFSSNYGAVHQLVDRRGATPAPSHDEPGLARWIAFGYDAIRTPSAGIQQAPHAGSLTFPLTKSVTPEQLSARNIKREAPGEFRRSLAPAWRRATAAERIDRGISDAVAGRLESDVPLACLLSGGVDSSLVSLMAQRHASRVTTVCVKMPDPRYDESDAAAELAGIIGSRHITVEASPHPAADLIVLIQTLGLPFGDSSLLPTFWACVAARDHAKVLVSGDGGDELFLGYERYKAAKWLSLFDPLVARSLVGLAPRGHPKSIKAKLVRLLRAAAGEGYPELLAIFDSLDRRELLDPRHRELGLRGTDVGSVHLAQRYDLVHHFPGDMLRKTDTASMIAGVELRAPLLARDLADTALSMNPTLLMPHGQRKGLLRRVARKYFPAEIVDRPKMGFAIPIGDWFRSDYGEMRTLLLDHLTSAEPFGPPSLGIDLNMDFVRRMLKEHDEAGEGALFPWKGRDHSQRLYMLLVLSIWAKWLGGMGR